MKKFCLQEAIARAESRGISRREFLARTARVSTAYVMAPTLFRLLTGGTNAYAATATPVFHLQTYLPGGAGWTCSVAPHGPNGLLSSYTSSGIPTPGSVSAANNAVVTKGADIWKNGPFGTALFAANTGLTGAELNFSTAVFASNSLNDVGTSALMTTPSIAQALATVNRTSIGSLGTAKKGVGVFKSIPATSPVQLSSSNPVSSFQALISANTGPFGKFSTSQLSALGRFVKSLNNQPEQQNAVLAQSAFQANELAQAVSSSYETTATKLSSTGTPPPTPQTDATVSKIFGTNPTGDALTYATIALAFKTGVTNAAYIAQSTNWDSHDNSNHNADFSNLATTHTIPFMKFFAAMGATYVIEYISDGGMTFSGNNMTADAQQKTISLAIYGAPAAAPLVTRPYPALWTAKEGVDTKAPTADNVTNADVMLASAIDHLMGKGAADAFSQNAALSVFR